MAERLGEAIVPVYPAAMRLSAPGLAAKAKAAAPEADLVALALPGKDPIRRARALVFLDPNRDLLEATAWPEGDAKTAAARIPEADRAAVLCSAVEHVAQFIFIFRRHDDHIGDMTQITVIKDAVMRGSVFSDNAGSVQCDYHRQFLQTDVM